MANPEEEARIRKLIAESVEGGKRGNAAFAQGYVRIGRLALMSGPVTETLGAVMAVSILWFGARLVLVEKSLDGALLVTFLIWVMRLLQPLKQLSQVPAAAQPALSAFST